jgi:hypothetical protein
MDEKRMVKEEVNTSETETNPNNIKQEVPFEFVGIKTEVQVKFSKSFVCGCFVLFMSIYLCLCAGFDG